MNTEGQKKLKQVIHELSQATLMSFAVTHKYNEKKNTD